MLDPPAFAKEGAVLHTLLRDFPSDLLTSVFLLLCCRMCLPVINRARMKCLWATHLLVHLNPLKAVSLSDAIFGFPNSLR